MKNFLKLKTIFLLSTFIVSISCETENIETEKETTTISEIDQFTLEQYFEYHALPLNSIDNLEEFSKSQNKSAKNLNANSQNVITIKFPENAEEIDTSVDNLPNELSRNFRNFYSDFLTKIKFTPDDKIVSVINKYESRIKYQFLSKEDEEVFKTYVTELEKIVILITDKKEQLARSFEEKYGSRRIGAKTLTVETDLIGPGSPENDPEGKSSGFWDCMGSKKGSIGLSIGIGATLGFTVGATAGGMFTGGLGALPAGLRMGLRTAIMSGVGATIKAAMDCGSLEGNISRGYYVVNGEIIIGEDPCRFRAFLDQYNNHEVFLHENQDTCTGDIVNRDGTIIKFNFPKNFK